jgi:hypothetical protein
MRSAGAFSKTPISAAFGRRLAPTPETSNSLPGSMIGQPNVQRTRDLIKLYVLQALRDEPRIESVVSANVFAENTPPRDSVRIELVLNVIGAPAPLNLVLPFALGVAL